MTNTSGRRWHPFRYLDKHLNQQFVRPTQRLIAAAVSGLVFILPALFIHASLEMFWFYNLLLLAASAVDILLLPGRKYFELSRKAPDKADMFQSFDVVLQIHNRSGKAVQYELRDDLPPDFDGMGTLKGTAGGRTEAVYGTAGRRRGRYTLRRIYLMYRGGLGLWSKQLAADAESVVKIYPDMSGVRGILASSRQQLILEGRKLFPKVMNGSAFHALRDYTADDDPRWINWRATARSAQLKTNVYQPEKGKTVTILLDCGRIMGVELNRRERLDRALEAALILSAVALNQDDLVSVLLFSNEIKAYIPPGKGLAHLRTILEAVYDVQSDFVESNYLMALEYLFRVQKRRNLAILFSDMENYMYAEQTNLYFMRMRKTHPVLLMSLQDELLNCWAESPALDEVNVYRKSVAMQMRFNRKRYVRRMSGQGIEVLDAAEEELALAAVNHYLRLKAGERL